MPPIGAAAIGPCLASSSQRPTHRLPPSRPALVVPSARMQPGRQERVWVHLYGPIVRDTVLIQKSLEPSSLVGIEDIGTAANKFARNENLRNRGHRSAGAE